MVINMKLLNSSIIVFITLNFWGISLLGMDKTILREMYRGKYVSLYKLWEKNDKKLTPEEQFYFLLSWKLNLSGKTKNKQELLSYIKQQEEYEKIANNVNSYIALITNSSYTKINTDVLSDIKFEVLLPAEKHLFNIANYILDGYQDCLLGLISLQIKNIVPVFKEQLGNSYNNEKIEFFLKTVSYALSIVFWEVVLFETNGMKLNMSQQEVEEILKKNGWLSEIVDQAGIKWSHLIYPPSMIVEFMGSQEDCYWSDWKKFVKKHTNIYHNLYDEAQDFIECYNRKSEVKNYQMTMHEEDLLKTLKQQAIVKSIYNFCIEFTKVDDEDKLKKD